MNRDELDAYYDKMFKPSKISRAIIPVDNSPPIKVLDFDEFEPSTYDEYVGQEKAKEFVQILSDAAHTEERFIPNILLTGSAGLGKTTLAKLILKNIPCMFMDGNSVNSNYQYLYSYAIIDEIHNIKPDVCDTLNVLLDQEKVHIIGCTTNPGILPAALRSRFRIVQLFPYTINDLIEIMKGVLTRKGAVTIPDKYLLEIARRGRSTPRRTLQYLSFVLDLMTVRKENRLSSKTLKEAFDKLGLDDEGLLDIDHKYLAAFPDDGRAVGLQYLSARLSVDRETIEEEIEPYLMELGYIDRTSKGRKRIE